MSGVPERRGTHVLEVRQGWGAWWFPVVDGVMRPDLSGFADLNEAWRFARAIAVLDWPDGKHSLPQQEAADVRAP